MISADPSDAAGSPARRVLSRRGLSSRWVFRGEFTGLNWGADFYAPDIDGLRREGEISLKVFLEACEEDGVSPRRQFSGKFMLRLDPRVHEEVAFAAAAEGKSLNQWVVELLEQATERRAKTRV